MARSTSTAITNVILVRTDMPDRMERPRKGRSGLSVVIVLAIVVRPVIVVIIPAVVVIVIVTIVTTSARTTILIIVIVNVNVAFIVTLDATTARTTILIIVTTSTRTTILLTPGARRLLWDLVGWVITVDRRKERVGAVLHSGSAWIGVRPGWLRIGPHRAISGSRVVGDDDPLAGRHILCRACQRTRDEYAERKRDNQPGQNLGKRAHTRQCRLTTCPTDESRMRRFSSATEPGPADDSHGGGSTAPTHAP